MIKLCFITFVLIKAVKIVGITHLRIRTGWLDMYVSALCYICNMGRSDLPDMYARARGRAAPECECGHIRQITTAHVTYVM